MRPRSLFLSWFAPAILLALGSVPAGAQIPHVLNYQGYLLDASSQPVNATVTMTFKLYSAALGGPALFTESQSVNVSNGTFSATIGATTSLTLPFNVPYFLGVAVSPDTEMTPRQAVLASPYALRAAGVDATAVLPGAQITGSITVATLPATQLSGTVGTAQIANSSVTPAKLSANYAGSASAGGPSTTALSLNANGGNCAAGQFAAGVDAQGNAEGCAAPPQGTVTSVGTGAGLTGGPITGSGTIAIDPASATLTGNFFRQGGNTFGALANTTAILGTNDGNALDVRVNGGRALRIEPNATSPNLIGGNAFNGVGANKVGSVVAGGGQLAIALNGVDANFGVVGGGAGNTVNGDYSAIAGGFFNYVQGNYSAVLGGNNNQVLGNYSLAGGRWAKASWAGQTVIADAVDLTFDPPAQGNWGGNGTNTFNVRATAGALFVTAIDGGGNTVKRTWFGNDGNAYTTGTFVNGSDRAAKERFAVVAARDVLERVAGLPVTKWSYKGQTQRHMGPVAQDFRAAFGLGHDDTTISTVDAAGVALAAIQGLHQLVREKDRELQRLRAKAAEVDALKRDLAAIKERLGMR